jgi:predicted nucleic acid-binding protein
MIVFDSSTLILLAKVELLDTFIREYKEKIMIPKAVEEEATIKETFDGLLIKKRIEEKRIEIKNVDKEKVENIKKDFKLGKGEAEAIILAEQEKSLLATDDRNAILACKIKNIQFTTAIDFVVRASEKKKTGKEEAKRKIDQLEKLGRYKKEIIDGAREKIGE